MKVALIVAELPDWGTNPMKGSDSYPIGLASLSAYAKAYARVPRLDVALFRELDDLIAYRPDIVGISAVTPGYRAIRPIASRVKQELGVPVVLGGSHASGLPGSMPAECDVGVIGEGEETFRELLEALAAGPLELCVLSRIRGIAYREGGCLVRTAPRGLIEDLDTIPIPDRALARGQWAMPGNCEQMISSRGCPYACSFCSIHNTMGRRRRCHSPERVVGEIARIREESDPSVIKLWDDLFTLGKVRGRAIVRAIEERGLHRDVVFSVTARSDLIDREWCDILKRMNVAVVTLGFESLSDTVLRFLGKSPVTAETNLRAADTIADAGLGVVGCFIVGAPGETRDDLRRTFHYMLDNSGRLYGVCVNALRAFPGTEVYEYARRRGLIDEQTLDGIAPRAGEETFLNNRAFVMNDYVYLNEENVPREEFAFYCDLFDKVMQILPPWYERKLQLQTVEAEVRRLRELQSQPLLRMVAAQMKTKLQNTLGGHRGPGRRLCRPVL